MRKTDTSYVKGRYRKFFLLLLLKHQPFCPICGQAFTEADIPARGKDELTEHHANGVHEDDRLENRVIVHRRCQKSHHTKDNLNSEDSKFWRMFA